MGRLVMVSVDKDASPVSDADGRHLDKEILSAPRCTETCSVVFWDTRKQEYTTDECNKCEKLNEKNSTILAKVIKGLNANIQSKKANLKMLLPPIIFLVAILLIVILIGVCQFDGYFKIVIYAVCGVLLTLSTFVFVAVLVFLLKRNINRSKVIANLVSKIQNELNKEKAYVFIEVKSEGNHLILTWNFSTASLKTGKLHKMIRDKTTAKILLLKNSAKDV